MQEQLTSREAEIARLLSLGYTNKEIAEQLIVSTHTVRTHIQNLSAKVGIDTSSGRRLAAHFARQFATEGK